ncbi:fungal-specific transcription factor domain-containing protein [Cercophora newfieldiana]|uniref:Fungal-specific transcription factor domain-containing protein n=1 Tax=Cercophora newfieldiana TaxID=92897 RepID=A0AA40CKF1_9PEZI|nr:fungal-specific transcription factor domain-containing protein [Cercophora newfieldiana]
MEQHEHDAVAALATPRRVFKRVSRACRRCRRLRTKCANQDGVPPCDPCRQIGAECSFPSRGEPDADRAFRQGPRHRTTTVTPPPSSLRTTPSPPRANTPGWESLPPYEEVIEGVQCLTTSFFQLGFLPKLLFFESLRTNPESANFFLLFSVLSVSARFTPSLVARYQGGSNATQVFLGQASCFVMEQMFVSSLESIQGFFLMSIAEWGRGDKNRSLVYMGIAIRLAGIMHLHREETYRIPESATNEDIVYSEVARRTFWMLETFENLQSDTDSPVSFSYSDITVLLPCSENEFVFGIKPAQRAALMGTPPAKADPGLAYLASRSLFATLLQTHSLWGQVARIASADAMQIAASQSAASTQVTSTDYDQLSRRLLEFEQHLPPSHAWSVWNLRAHKLSGLDLAFLSAAMILRLSNIILRRSYLHCLLQAHADSTDPSHIAVQLYTNMLTLHSQIAAFFEFRSPDQGYPALIVFCAYVCGTLANHLHRQPQHCPAVAPQALAILKSSMRGLEKLQGAWPFAQRWCRALKKMTEDLLTVPERGDQRATAASPVAIQV